MLKTLLAALEEYRQIVGEQEEGNIRSYIKNHLLHQLLDIWKLQSLQDKKIKYILDKIPSDGFVEIADPIFRQTLLSLENLGTRKVIKSKWKRFCQWLQGQDWYSSELLQPIHCSEEIIESDIQKFTHLPKKSICEYKVPEKTPYRFGLQEQQLTPILEQQLQDFRSFCQTVSRRRKSAIRDITHRHDKAWILLFLGWMKNIQNIPIEDLSLECMLDLDLLKKYEFWNEERGMASKTITNYLKPCVLICKFLNKSLSDDEFAKVIKPYRDFVNAIPDRKDRPRTTDEACKKRALSRSECEIILKYLEWRCKDLERQYGITAKVVNAWMDYLIIALLVTTGVRQREIRELCFERLTLESDKTYSVEVTPDQHKNGSKTGRGRKYPLFVGPFQKQLSCDLSYYIEHVRPKNLNHEYLFFIRSTHGKRYRGDKINSETLLTAWVPKLIHSVTAHLFGCEKARQTTCHDFRRITATWVCTYGTPAHFAMYAEMLGHSVEMLQKLYAKTQAGDLAAQVPFAYNEIAANEAKVAQRFVENEHKERSSIQKNEDSEIEMLKVMAKMFLGALPKSKRQSIFESLTPSQRQLIGI